MIDKVKKITKGKRFTCSPSIPHFRAIKNVKCCEFSNLNKALLPNKSLELISKTNNPDIPNNEKII